MERNSIKKNTIMSQREKRINDALSYYGLSVIIRNEQEFNHIKKFLGDDVLYLDFVPQMATKLTSIVIWSNMKEFSTGSVGCAKSQKDHFIRLVEFNDFFKV
jgi:hypothetical protein